MSRAEDAVVVKNIYYMMAYAFRAIDIADFKRLEVESFGNVLDLLAAILAAGLDAQRRRGFEREYQLREEDLMRVRGRIGMTETMRLRMRQRRDLHCVFDERTEDTYKNRVLRTTALYLLRAPEVDTSRKRDLKRSLGLMQDVCLLDPQRIAWGSMRYHRNNRSYQFLMNVCYLVLHELLFRDERGKVRLADVLNGEALHRLYEKFILEYFRKHWNWLDPAAREIDRGIGDTEPDFLPRMLTDVTLTNGGQAPDHRCEMLWNDSGKPLRQGDSLSRKCEPDLFVRHACGGIIWRRGFGHVALRENGGLGARKRKLV